MMMTMTTMTKTSLLAWNPLSFSLMCQRYAMGSVMCCRTMFVMNVMNAMNVIMIRVVMRKDVQVMNHDDDDDDEKRVLLHPPPAIRKMRKTRWDWKMLICVESCVESERSKRKRMVMVMVLFGDGDATQIHFQ